NRKNVNANLAFANFPTMSLTYFALFQPCEVPERRASWRNTEPWERRIARFQALSRAASGLTLKIPLYQPASSNSSGFLGSAQEFVRAADWRTFWGLGFCG